jgi:hypothetical protein
MAAARIAVGQDQASISPGSPLPIHPSAQYQLSADQSDRQDKIQEALYRPGRNDPRAIKVGESDTHYNKTAVLGILGGLPDEWALKIGSHAQYRDDDPKMRPLDDTNIVTMIWSGFTNADALLGHHFILSSPDTGKVPAEDKILKYGPDGKVDLSPPEGPGTALGKMWQRVIDAIGDESKSADEVADLIGDYIHAFQDTFTHRDENNIPIDAIRKIGSFRLGLGHFWYGSHPDYTYNHVEKLLGLIPIRNWKVNEERNLQMDKMVYERLHTIGAMLKEKRGVEIGQAQPWGEVARNAEDVNSKPVNVQELMKQFNSINEHEKTSIAGQRNPGDFKGKLTLLNQVLEAWGYGTVDKATGLKRPFNFLGPDAYKWPHALPVPDPVPVSVQSFSV